MLTLEQAYEKQTDLKEQISELEQKLEGIKTDPCGEFEIELTELYDQFLDETYGYMLENLPFKAPPASEMMQSADPIMYHTGFNDFVDSFCQENRFSELDGFEELEEEIEDLQEELEALEEEIEELESEE